MKRFFFSFMLIILCVTIKAQLQITPSGNAVLGTEGNNGIVLQTNGSIYSPLLGDVNLSHTVSVNAATSYTQKVAIYGQAVSTTTMSNIATCGVKGIAGRGRSGFNYGVMGVLDLLSNGAGVYGSSKVFCSSISGRYAGYFDGDVKVTQALTVDGSITTPNIFTDILPIGNISNYSIVDGLDCISRFSNLDVISYPQKVGNVFTESSVIEENDSQSAPADYELTHYAFSRESISQMFPELVVENEDGEAVINYLDLIPLLVKSVSELSKRVDELETENMKLRQSGSYNGSNSPLNVVSGSGNAYQLTGIRKSSNSALGASIKNGSKTFYK